MTAKLGRLLPGLSSALQRKLEQFAYTFAGDDWIHSANDAAAIAPTITDELHAMLVKRADDLEGCPVGSDEERELAAIERAIGAYGRRQGLGSPRAAAGTQNEEA